MRSFRLSTTLLVSALAGAALALPTGAMAAADTTDGPSLAVIKQAVRDEVRSELGRHATLGAIQCTTSAASDDAGDDADDDSSADASAMGGGGAPPQQRPAPAPAPAGTDAGDDQSADDGDDAGDDPTLVTESDCTAPITVHLRHGRSRALVGTLEVDGFDDGTADADLVRVKRARPPHRGSGGGSDTDGSSTATPGATSTTTASTDAAPTTTSTTTPTTAASTTGRGGLTSNDPGRPHRRR